MGGQRIRSGSRVASAPPAWDETDAGDGAKGGSEAGMWESHNETKSVAGSESKDGDCAKTDATMVLQQKVVALGGELDRLSVELERLRSLVLASAAELQKSSTQRQPADSLCEEPGVPSFPSQADSGTTIVEVLS